MISQKHSNFFSVYLRDIKMETKNNFLQKYILIK